MKEAFRGAWTYFLSRCKAATCFIMPPTGHPTALFQENCALTARLFVAFDTHKIEPEHVGLFF
jgi:hypothetical protein